MSSPIETKLRIAHETCGWVMTGITFLVFLVNITWMFPESLQFPDNIEKIGTPLRIPISAIWVAAFVASVIIHNFRESKSKRDLGVILLVVNGVLAALFVLFPAY